MKQDNRKNNYQNENNNNNNNCNGSENNKFLIDKSDRSRLVRMNLLSFMSDRQICQNCLKRYSNKKEMVYRKKYNQFILSYYHFRCICKECDNLTEFRVTSLKKCKDLFNISQQDLDKFGINIIKNDVFFVKNNYENQQLCKHNITNPKALSKKK